MLEGRILTQNYQEFELAAWDGENRSRYEPLDDKILVLVDRHVDVLSTGIELPDGYADRQTMAAEHGIVVAIGPAAFRWNDETTRAWEGRRPEPGDRVYIERYAGQLLNGDDGRQYRLMSQKCVGAVQRKPAVVVEMKTKRKKRAA